MRLGRLSRINVSSFCCINFVFTLFIIKQRFVSPSQYVTQLPSASFVHSDWQLLPQMECVQYILWVGSLAWIIASPLTWYLTRTYRAFLIFIFVVVIKHILWRSLYERLTLLDPQMYKFPQVYKSSLKCIKINHNCIKHPQMYKNWPHLYKQGIDKCINYIDHHWLKLALSQPQMYKNQPQMYKYEFSSLQLPSWLDKCCFRFYRLETIYCYKM